MIPQLDSDWLAMESLIQTLLQIIESHSGKLTLE